MARLIRLVAALLVLGGALAVAHAATRTPGAQPQAGRLVVLSVHSGGLAGTATGEDPDRQVSVYLPPSYDREPGRRYRVLYLLHGIGGTDADWTSGEGGWNTIASVMDRSLILGRVDEMIVVMPDASSNLFGSFYVNSAATGDWQDFIVQDLVAFIDSHLRTIPDASSRGIAGHSMGGYGAIRLAMLYPDVFSMAYGMNPAALGLAGDLSEANPVHAILPEMSSRDALTSPDPRDPSGFYRAGLITIACAFSPNPRRPPL